jgi:hypothetical protein
VRIAIIAAVLTMAAGTTRFNARNRVHSEEMLRGTRGR